MSELRIETWTLPAADLGPENPLPPLVSAADAHAAMKIDPAIPEEDRRHVGYGNRPSCYPYRLQDGYGRELRQRPFRVAVLENEFLRAAFFLEVGGRLWSLVHKPSGRELLESNPIFQPANVALRNAWCSGGVEWNIGLVGHCPFTCSPLFAARVEGSEGTPVLRLYEWERMRQTPFQIDAWLPDGSPVLFVRVRIRNPHPAAVPMYWWSNMAVPEREDTRVVVPAPCAYRFAYDGMIRVTVPYWEGKDVTWSTRQDRAMDYFFRIPDAQRRWIAALDAGGRGLVQTSTDRLRGRKLFLWGQGGGGRRWQQFLSRPDRAYIEIQAGLALTQAEHLPMPAGAEWSWLEAYGLMEADASVVHGRDWERAWKTVDERLERLISRAALAAEHERSAAMADRPPAEILQRGSGWGALEGQRRQVAGEPRLGPASMAFDEASLGPDQAPWLALLREGVLPEPQTDEDPGAWASGADWRRRLEASVREERGANGFAWLHLGALRYEDGDKAGARLAWEASLARRRSPWALRNLAILAREEKRFAEAADLLLGALRLRPSCVPLAIECGRGLIEAERPAEWLALLAGLPPVVRASGRVRLLEGRAALVSGDLARVERVLADAASFADIREGEASLTDLWFGLQEQRLAATEQRSVDDALRSRVRREFPPPPLLDFRMAPEPAPASAPGGLEKEA